MLIHGTQTLSSFGLGACDENAGTNAVGWCVEKAPAFRKEILHLIDVKSDLHVVVRSQVYAGDRGFTDLELTADTSLHAIFEAKLGWQVPAQAQLRRYIERLTMSKARHKRLVSVSAADQAWAKRHLPRELDGVAVIHMSWSDIQHAAKRAMAATRSLSDKLWLSELVKHLEGYGMTSNIFDARVYVVALNRARIDAGNPLTWVDVVTNQGRYFHPVGGGNRSGWPTIPPAYLGFRYHSEFRSAHFVESVTTTDNLQDVDSRWPATNTPHFVYTLGPPMIPSRPMPLGKIHPSMRNWISIDMLLSGVARDYKDAVDMMQKRNRSSGVGPTLYGEG